MSYIECLEKDESLQNKGKNISEVKNKLRSLKTFLTRAQTALIWSKHSRHSSEGAENGAYTSGTREKYLHGIDSLSDKDKTKIEQVIFFT